MDFFQGVLEGSWKFDLRGSKLHLVTLATLMSKEKVKYM